jgi:2-keto-3-deoxy-L-rhamnonate aldolase RhmA
MMPGMAAPSLVDTLRHGGTVLCVGVRTFAGEPLARVLKDGGVGALYIDLEHGAAAMSAALPMLDAARQIGMHVLARSAGFSAAQVREAALPQVDGVIVPGLRDPAEVRGIAAALAAASREQGAGRRLLFIGMIESAPGVTNLDAILAVGALDLVFLGMSDLTADLGVHRQWTHPLVEDAFDACLQACERHDVLLGIGGMGASPESLARFARRGARFLSLGSDEDILRQGLALRRESLREFLAR